MKKCAVKEAGEMAQLCKYEDLSPALKSKSDTAGEAWNPSTGEGKDSWSLLAKKA